MAQYCDVSATICMDISAHQFQKDISSFLTFGSGFLRSSSPDFMDLRLLSMVSRRRPFALAGSLALGSNAKKILTSKNDDGRVSALWKCKPKRQCHLLGNPGGPGGLVRCTGIEVSLPLGGRAWDSIGRSQSWTNAPSQGLDGRLVSGAEQETVICRKVRRQRFQ